MTKELQKFMYEDTLKANSALNAHLGKKVVVVFNQTEDANMPPMQKKIMGPLLDISPFENINVGGKTIDFVSKLYVISEIIDTETNTRLYDKTLIVDKNTKVQGDVRVLRKLIFGTENIPSKNLYGEFNLGQNN